MHFKRFSLVAWALLATVAVIAQSSSFWPQEIAHAKGKIVVYQPQPQSIDGNKVSGISAFSVTPTGKKDPIFGALFFDAVIDMDRDARTYVLESFSLPNVKFSSEIKEKVDYEKLKQVIIEGIMKSNFKGSYDELLASIADYKATVNKGKENLNNNPPKIIFTTKVSMLILVDGEPHMKEIKNTDLEYIQNTPYVIFHGKKDGKYYLYGGDIWYTSTNLKGSWSTTKNVPKEITKIMEENKDKAAKAEAVKMTDKDVPPAIIVATEPTELIQTKGEPNYVPVPGSTELLYAKNSDDNLFKEITSNKFYILKSGRWFASTSLDGPWNFVDPEKLSAEFQKIQPGSEKDIVRASIPGTDEAREAVLDAQVPQMATVDRKTGGKDLKVEYDGAPQFKQIEGTSLQLAENANKTVIKSGSKYYCVDNGVWYRSANYNGPWEVSDERPADVENIPASSSAYNTKYVNVYEATADVVYVGYTPGYTGSYVYGPTVVYGTGWYYPPYYGSFYYPHQWTWGFNMSYNPWTGWGFGFSFSNGPFHFGFGTGGFTFGFGMGFGYPMYGYGGMFGCPIYRPPCFPPAYPWYGYNRPGYGGGNRPINSPGGGNINWGGGNQINIGGDVNINVGGNQVSHNKANNNIYNRSNQSGNKAISSGTRNLDASRVNAGARPGTQPAKPGTQPAKPSTRPAGGGAQPGVSNNMGSPKKSNLPNNVYADRDGNVYQRDNKSGEWKQNDGSGFKSMNNSPQVNNNRAGGTDQRQQLDRSAQDRSRGSARTNTYQSAPRSSSGMSRSMPSGGGARMSGGGGRRR